MRHILTMLIAFHWMTVFAMLATCRPSSREHGILPRCVSSAPIPCATRTRPAVGRWRRHCWLVAFAIASLLFLWTLLTVALGDGFFGSQTEEVARRAFGCGSRRRCRCC